MKTKAMTTPKLLNPEDEREVSKRVAKNVQSSAQRLKALDERNRAIQRENPGLPLALAKSRGPATAELPPKFSWEDHHGASKIQNQNPAGTCWAFARIGAL